MDSLRITLYFDKVKEVNMKQSQFRHLMLNQTIEDVIKKLQFEMPTEVQERVIPPILEGKSVIGQSHTGSGKTHAFLLPLFNKLDEEKQEVQFIITLPTRELAMQLFEEVKKIIHLANKETKWIAKLLIGGTDKQRMAESLKNPPHIIVGTPGRILDLVNDGAVSIYSAQSFVVDEADLMLDLGFIDDVDQLLIKCKSNIQLLAFSATIPTRLEHFFKKYLSHPLYIKLDDEYVPPQMEHRLVAFRNREPSQLIIDLTAIFNPYLAIIFVNGKEDADHLAAALQKKGLDVGIIHGGLSPRERKRVLKQIKELRYQYIVATDLASRGIDIEGVSHVINAALPKEEDFYIHRVGRTARAGLEGLAVSFYDDEDISLIERLENNGIEFIYSDIKDGEWIKAKPWNERFRRKRTTTNIDQEAWKRVRKPKKVKPGYKKKMKKEQEAIKRKLMRNSKRR